MQSVNHLVGVEFVDNVVVVDKLVRQVFQEDAVDQVEGVDWLEETVVGPFVQLPDVGLRGVEDDPLHEHWAPQRLHLHNELTARLVGAPHVHYAVAADWGFGHHLRCHVFHLGHLPVVRQGQQ